MEQKGMNQSQTLAQKPVQPSRPNETGALNIDEFLRISDPETKQVFVEQRA